MKRSGRVMRAAVLLGLTLLSCVALYPVQVKLEGYRAGLTASDAIRFVPSGRFLKTAVVGYDNFVADILWIRGIALFGDRYKASGDQQWYEWLYQLVDLATELDPLDLTFYKYGGLLLRVGGARVDQSSLIFYKGMQHLPDEYYLPFGVAMNYLEHKSDVVKAADYMRRASVCRNAPFYLRNLAASLLEQSEQDKAALIFLQDELKMLQPGSLQYKTVEVKILDVKHAAGAGQLQRAFTEYMSVHRKVPERLEEVTPYLPQGKWPEDPYGGTFVLDPSSGRIRSSRYGEAREAIRKEVGLGAEVEAISGPRQGN